MVTLYNTTLICAFSGETDDNVNRIIQGQKDTPLNDNGPDQARQLGGFFLKQDQKFDLVFASDLKRTRETASLALGPICVDFTLEKRIRERVSSISLTDKLPRSAFDLI